MTESASSVPSRSLPFTALRAIEAAVRHRSYTSAARELNLTHAAISQAIKRLEKELDLKLFERRGQSMEPSDIALQLADAYSEATGTLHRSLDGILWPKPTPRAIVAMPPDLARLWFIPRLNDLSRRFSDLAVELRPHGSGTAANEEINVALGFDPVTSAGWSSEPIGPVTVFPVCSPIFATRYAMARASDLRSLPLLAERRWPWALWFGGAGYGRKHVSHAHLFDDANLTLDAAVRGHGVALTHIFAAEEYLRAGTLTVPIALQVTTPESLHLSWRNHDVARDTLPGMIDWLKSELRGSEAGRASFLHKAG